MSRSNFITFNPGVMTNDADLFHVLKASTTYGGMTVIAARATQGAATGGAGTSHQFLLVNYGTSGTVAGGTIAATTASTAAWVADTPKEFTITAAQAYVDAGEWIVLKKLQQGADSDNDVQTSITIEYVEGVVTQG